MNTTISYTQNNNFNNQNTQSFFEELSKKDDVRAVGSIFKNFYDLIQQRKELLPGQTTNAIKNFADLKAKTADIHNWILYKYGSGSLADQHLEIVKKVMEGDIDELNSIENIVHITNQSRGIREVDELISTILYGKPQSYHSEDVSVKEGDITKVKLHLNKNMVDQNNLTDPQNPLNVLQQGVQITPVIFPRHLTLVEQMNGAENMIMNVLKPNKKYNTEHQTVSVRSLNP